MPYSPQPPISVSTLEEMRSWLNEELRSIALAVNETQVLDLRPSSRAPDRLRDGVMVYADGTNFNPGSGEGPYIWDGAAWRPMIGLTTAQSAAITSNITTNTNDITTLKATSPPGLVFLLSQAVSNSATVVFTGISSVYDAYQFHITRMKPSVDGATLRMQMSVNGGSTWKTTSNSFTWVYTHAAANTVNPHNDTAEGSAANFRITGVTSSAWANSSEVMLYPSTVGIGLNMCTWRSIDWFGTTNAYQVIGSGVETSDSTPCNAVRFFFNSGNMVSGRITMYGVRKT